MAIALDHFIVSSKNKAAAAQALGEILGVPWAAQGLGPFAPVYLNAGLTLDFFETSDAFPVEHYCFRVSADEFSAILARIQAANIPYRSTVTGEYDYKVNAHYGNFYWNVPDGHQWELLITSYARQSD